MKYWILTTEYPPFFGGGISTYCFHTAKMLSSQNHDVTVFVNDENIIDLKIDYLNEARIIRFNPTKTKSYSFLGHTTNLSYEFAHILKTFIEKEGKPDIIESQDYNGIAYFLLQFKYCLYEWCKDIPVILTLHSPSFLYAEYNQVPLYKRPNYWVGEMEKFCIQATTTLISPSNFLVQELKKRLDLSNKKIHIIPNPFEFELDKKNSLPSKKSVTNNDITFYGKLSAQKGIFKILEIFREYWKKKSSLKLILIGGQDIVFHPLNKTMGDIVKNENHEHIKSGKLILKNGFPSLEIKSRFLDSLFFIVPSIVDNLPYVVLELMSLGKIVLVSNSGGQAEIISNGINGFIFDYSVENELENQINKMIQLKPEEKINISQKAISTIKEKYSYINIYKKKSAIFRENYSGNTAELYPFIRKENLFKSPKTIVFEKQLLSIIIPFYNLGKYIDETINSILNSTYKNIEILIINDGSTEIESIKKLESYKINSKIKVINKENTGLADTRNYGANLAQGEFIAFLDADDTIAPNYYSKGISILSNYNNVYFVGAWTKYFGNSNNIWPTFNTEPPIILTHNTINSSSLIYKKEAFLSFGKNDPQFKIGLEDYESMISLISNGMYGVAIPDILFNYRVRNKSMIKSVTSEVREKYYDIIVKKHPSLFNKYKLDIEQLIKSNSSPLTTDNSTLDSYPFENNPLLRKISRLLIVKSKSNPTLKKNLLRLKNIFFS